MSILVPVCIGNVVSKAHAAETTAAQTLNVDYKTITGDFHGGASGMLYGLGDEGSPTDAILDGARVQVTSQKPADGLQHPSADVIAVEKQFFSNGGQQLVVNLQDWYPDWAYNGGKRPGDTRNYKLDVDPNNSAYGTYTDSSPNGRWDFDEVIETVMNKILANTSHPDDIVFMPFNEPDGGNWYASGDNAGAAIYKQFLTDWNEEYATIQKVWNQYKTGERKNINGIKPTADHALVAGPGDSVWRPNRTKALLSSAKQNNTLPDVVVWHELGSGSLKSYRNHYNQYRGFEKELGISARAINISEFGELRDMSVPGQLVQWMSMFEDTKVQAQTAYWNYAGNLNDNMSRANSANGGWWMYKWYGDLRGTQTAKVTSEHPDSIDTLQGIAAIDKTNRKATVLYGGANDSTKIGADIPVKIHLSGLDNTVFTDRVDVQVRENVYTGPDGVAATPRVVNVLNDQKLVDGSLDVTTTSTDRYAGYQLVVTPHQDVQTAVDDANNGRSLEMIEAENTQLSGGATAYSKSDNTGSWGNFMFSGNADVGNFKNGAKMTWSVNVPADGSYRLQLLTAPAGFPGTNKVSVDGKDAGTLNIPAELALKDAAKWKYRGSAEIVLQNLTKGKHDITVEASNLDNETDKLLLYQVSSGHGSPVDQVTYPASDMRLSDGANLSYQGNGTNGFANLNGGSVDVFAHAWEAGYQDVTVTYNAVKASQMRLRLNGQQIATITAAADGLQSSTIRVAMSEGINQLTLGGINGEFIKSITTARTAESDALGIPIQAEDTKLSGGATIQKDESSNAEGKSFVSGLGNQFVTNQSGKAGYGDQTRVEADANHVPSVIQSNKGMMTVSGVPAGTYNMVVRFSNNAFIGSHSYNPQVADLGLQVRENGKEIARGSFRYTYTDKHFMNRSINVTTKGGDLTLGNWDEIGSQKAAVSWGVAPNIDSITLYPVTIGEIKSITDPGTLDSIEAKTANAVLTKGSALKVDVDANYAGGSRSTLTEGQYRVEGFEADSLGKQTVTIIYKEGLVERRTSINVTVVDPNTIDRIVISGKNVTGGKASLKEGDVLSLTAAVIPASVKNGSVRWFSSDARIAVVDRKGLVKALRPGTVTITAASAVDSSIQDSVEVKVITNGQTANLTGRNTEKPNGGNAEDAVNRPSLASTGSSVIPAVIGVVVLTIVGICMINRRNLRN